MVNYIQNLLYDKGYKQVDKDVNGILFCEKKETVFVVTLSGISQQMTLKDYSIIQSRTEFALATRFQKRVECFHIILTKNGMFEQETLQLAEQLPNGWLVAEDTGKVYIFEHQISDFDNLYFIFEENLPEYAEKIRKERKFRITPVNAIIVSLNIVFFLAVIMLNGDFRAVLDTEIMLSMGALSFGSFADGAWYQLVTSLFLHFGISHLLNNMILLTYIGCELEQRIGSVLYSFIYFGTGIIGNIVSLWYYNYAGVEVVSAGASGAIFGVIGALFVIMITYHMKTPNLSPAQLFIMVGIAIYHGMSSANVDNAAHIGGLFAGIIGGFLLSKISQYGKLEEVRFMR